MNDQDLERQLRALKPAPPSNDLMVRLQRARPAGEAPRPGWMAWLLRAAVPAAAAVALALLVSLWHPEAVKPAARTASAMPETSYEPVEARDFILGARQIGVGHTADGQPYRVLHAYGLQRAVWKNSRDGSKVATVEPQQQILLAKMDVF